MDHEHIWQDDEAGQWCLTCPAERGHPWLSPILGTAVEHSIQDPFTGEITVRFRVGDSSGE